MACKTGKSKRKREDGERPERPHRKKKGDKR